MLHFTRHTSHVTRHTSHVTRHTSYVTRHTSHVTPITDVSMAQVAVTRAASTPRHTTTSLCHSRFPLSCFALFVCFSRPSHVARHSFNNVTVTASSFDHIDASDSCFNSTITTSSSLNSPSFERVKLSACKFKASLLNSPSIFTKSPTRISRTAR